MSFRNRLTLFFVLIVIVPMASIAIILFRLIDESETGKTDARVSQGQTAALGLYREEVETASRVAGRIGTDPVIGRALRDRNDAAVAARVRALARDLQVRRIRIERRGQVLVDVGGPNSTAAASRALIGSDGTTIGTLSVSTITGAQYARHVKRVTGLDIAVRRGNTLIGATLAGMQAEMPRRGDLDLGDRAFRVSTFAAADAGQDVQVAVLADATDSASDVSGGRTLIAIVLAVFLALVSACAVLVSRSLHGEIEQFLVGARRLGTGDFSTPVKTEGNDEFAQLGDEFNKMSEQLEQRLDELQAERARFRRSIRRLGETFAANLDRGGLLEIVVQASADAVGADAGRATVRDDPDEPLEERAVLGALGPFSRALHAAESAALASSLCEQATVDARSALAYPLGEVSDRPLGLVSVAREGGPFSQEEVELFSYLSGQAALSIENVDLHELVQRQAVTDEATGLFNHRRFQEVIGGEVERARRFDQPLGLVILDLDHFKQVNDTYGHQQGDRVLRAVARVLRDFSREIDEPARYGGEEFAVALPQTDLDGAYSLAERVRVEVEALGIERLDGQGDLSVTASFGVSALPDNSEDKDGLIAAADAALYRAKRNGRNRTERADVLSTKTAPAK